MKQNSPWRIEGRTARLETEQLRTDIDLLNPSRGVRILAAAGAAVHDATLFRIGLPPLSPSLLTGEGRGEGDAVPSAPFDDRDLTVDFFSRGNDLVATYSERPEHPFRAQIYWRLLPSALRVKNDDALHDLAGLELILSIQTSLLDSDPALTVESEVAAAGASRLADMDSCHFVDLPASIAAVPVGPESGLGLFQFRIPDRPLFYTEMIYPADFHQSTLVSRAPDLTTLAHHLFAQRLEKGVILRSRIRGIFAPADAAPAAIARAYQEFASSGPPLTV